MEAKQYLLGIRRCDSRIETKLSEIGRYRDIAMNMTKAFTGDRVDSTPEPDKIGRCVAQMEDLSHEVDNLLDKRKEIVGTINSIDNPDQSRVLYKIYAEGKDFRETAYDMRCSYSRIKSVHGAGLLTVENILKDRKSPKSPKKAQDVPL